MKLHRILQDFFVFVGMAAPQAEPLSTTLEVLAQEAFAHYLDEQARAERHAALAKMYNLQAERLLKLRQRTLLKEQGHAKN
jgi:Mn-dependent DtxR family transcriptional regulator